MTRDVLERLLPADRCPRLAVRLWDGAGWGAAEPDFTLVLDHPGALRAMLLPPSELAMGEAYIFGDFDVEGDMEAAVAAGELLKHAEIGTLERVGVLRRLASLPSAGSRGEAVSAILSGSRHSKARDRAAISYHYDVSNDFYALWLDPQLVYSCAFFAGQDEDLAPAQSRKLDYICRKLRLAPGERLLDIGCGWGALVRHAAREYGVEATGVTLSERQAELARETIDAEGLADRCRVELLDYRDVPEQPPFDKLVSVGMFEHVGVGMLPEYFEKAARLLRPGGVFLNHGIARNPMNTGPPRSPFSERYVFPDGELSAVSETLAAAEEAGFEVRDDENLREHYALTLRHWVRRLEAREAEGRSAIGDERWRTWRLFMAASAHAFATNALQLHQSLLAKPSRGRSGMPLSREDWYR